MDIESIYKCKTKYVGDASKVGNLTSRLYYSEYKKGISLKTASMPYGINIKYKVKPEDISQDGVYGITNNMLKNAAIIFCFVENVDTIIFTYDDRKGAYSFLEFIRLHLL